MVCNFSLFFPFSSSTYRDRGASDKEEIRCSTYYSHIACRAALSSPPIRGGLPQQAVYVRPGHGSTFLFCRPSPPQAKYGRRGERSPIFPRLPTEPQIRASLGHEKTLFPSFAAIRSSAKQKREGRGGGGVCGVCDAHQHFYMARKSEGARRQEKVAEKGAEEEEATTKGRGRNAAAHLKGKREEEESDDASHSTSSSSPLFPLLLPQEDPTALPLLSLFSSVLLLLLFLLPASTQRKKETAEDGPPTLHLPSTLLLLRRRSVILLPLPFAGTFVCRRKKGTGNGGPVLPPKERALREALLLLPLSLIFGVGRPIALFLLLRPSLSSLALPPRETGEKGFFTRV